MSEENKYQLMALDPAKSLQLFTVAEKLHAAKMYENLRSPEAIFAVVQYGAELGFGPMTSLQNISIIKGKPCCDAKFLLALMKIANWEYRIIESSEKRCCLEFKKGAATHKIEYTIEEAAKAGLAGKDNWKKFPKDMLFNRCASRASRWLASETTAGIYTKEEVEEFDEPKIGPDNAKNVTPEKLPETEEYPPYLDKLSDFAKEMWPFLLENVVPQLQSVNERLMGSANIPGFNHEAHLCNAVAQFARERSRNFSNKNWWIEFRDWHKAKKEAEAKSDEKVNETTGEVQVSPPTDEIPWDDSDMHKELVACFDDDTIKIFKGAFKKAGINIKTDKELLALVRDAAKNAVPKLGLDAFHQGITEYGNALIAYKKKIDLENINQRIPPG